MARNSNDWYYRATRPILSGFCLIAFLYFDAWAMITGQIGGLAHAYSGAEVPASSQPKTFVVFFVLHLGLAAWCGWELYSLIFRGIWPGDTPPRKRRGRSS